MRPLRRQRLFPCPRAGGAERRLLQGSTLAAMGLDATGRVLWLNAAMARATGLGLAQARQRAPWVVLLGSATAVAERQRLARALQAREATQALVVHQRPGAAPCWLQLELQPRPGGAFLAVGVDVSGQQAQAARARQLVDHAAAGVLVQDGAGRITDCNAEAERLLGAARAELLGRTGHDRVWRALGGDGLPLAEHPALATLADGQARREQLIALQRPDGERRWLRLATARLGQGAGALVMSSFTDVTGQQLAYADLQAERARLAQALQGTHAGVWSWDDALGEVHLDAQCAAMLGREPQALQHLPASAWLDLVHPEQVAQVRLQVQRLARHHDDSLDVELRMRHASGHWVWVQLQGRVTRRSPQGLPQAMLGTQSDIQRRKLAELAQQRAHGQLQALFELSPAGIMLSELHGGRHVDANDALLAMAGLTHAEFLACPADALTPPEHHDEDRRQHALLARAGHCGPYEKELLHRDGRRTPVLASAMRVAQPDGSELVWTIVQDVSRRRQLEQQLLNAARSDALTGLPNRRMLMDRLRQAVAEVRAEPGRCFTLFFLDFDRFKLVNDSLGHEAGDALLRQVARRLRRTLRAGDVVGEHPGGNLVARFGGDEFAVLLNDTHDAEGAHAVAQRLLQAFAQPYFVRGREIHSSVSIGIVLGDGEADADALLRNADTAMYEAKRAGRGRAVFFDLGMHTRLARALAVEEALRHAVQRGQLSLVYQPIVDLASGNVTSAEALVRWQHPELGVVSPVEFIPVAEDSGLILDIGEWVLREAARQWARWRAARPQAAPVGISVNLSRVQMGHPERLLAVVREVLAAQHMPPGCLQLEVTEREVMRELGPMRELMQALRGLGVKLAMDDFGTGTSSLGCLRDHPFDVVKIDKSFLAGLHNSPDVMAVMHATVTVIENLGMASVAEGVETAAQVALLQAIGCRSAQGYLFARPMAGDLVLPLLAKQLTAPEAEAA